MDGRVIAGLDIGSTKVCALIGVVRADCIDVVGIGTAPCAGIKKGMVVNIEATTEAIRKAKEEAELMSGHMIQEAWIAIGGSHLQSFTSRGMIAIKNREVNAEDIKRVIEAAKAISVPNDREVLHVIPRDFKLDEQDSITDPMGMSGIRLESSVHIVTASKSAVQNFIKCANKAGLQCAGLVAEPLASSLAVLNQEEKNLGVAVVDVGGGSTHIVTYTQGSISYLASLPVGGHHITHDISLGLRTPYASAENIKKKYGAAMVEMVSDQETVDVEGVAGREPRAVMKKHLAEIIQPRCEEMIAYIYAELQKSSQLELLGAGIVLTGGASLLDGFTESFEFLMDLPVRRGTPKGVGGLVDVVKSPSFSTSVGLLLFGKDSKKEKLTHSGLASESMHQWFKKIKHWFEQGLTS